MTPHHEDDDFAPRPPKARSIAETLLRSMPVNGGGRIISDAKADLLKPITKCECLWGTNECPNHQEWVIVCRAVKGFTVACEPHAVNFAMNVDPHDGSYVYMTVPQFERAKGCGLYSEVDTYAEWWRANCEGALLSYDFAVRIGVFP